MTTTGSYAQFEPQPQQLAPRPIATAEVTKMRWSDLLIVSKRLGRVTKHPWSQWTGGLAVLCIGAALGGGLGGIPWLSSKSAPKGSSVTLYFVVVGFFLLIGLLLLVAAFLMAKTHSDTVTAIKADFDDFIIGAYEPPKPQETSPAAPQAS